MYLLIFITIHWYLSLFLQSFFHHRYAAHHMFSMSKFWERFFYICCFITHGSSYLSPSAYAIMHRLHHAHTDAKEDPHSPHNSSNIFSMLIKGRNYYFNIFAGKTEIEEKYKKRVPAWEQFDLMAHSWITRALWVLVYIAIYIWLVEKTALYFLLPLTIAMGTIQGAIVNWWAHVYGYENFPMNNTSKNILPVDILFCGEAYHNNHHKHPGKPNNAYKWFEFDTTYFIMRLFSFCRIIRFNKLVS